MIMFICLWVFFPSLIFKNKLCGFELNGISLQVYGLIASFWGDDE